MRPLLLLVFSLTLLPDLAFSYSENESSLPSSVAGWKIIAVRTDTGEAHSCRAEGAFSHNQIVIMFQNTSGSYNLAAHDYFISVAFSSYQKPKHVLATKSEIAHISLNGQDIGTGEIRYQVDLQEGNTYEYSANFQNMSQLSDKLKTASSLTISTNSPEFKPVSMNNLNLPGVAEALEQCLRSTR